VGEAVAVDVVAVVPRAVDAAGLDQGSLRAGYIIALRVTHDASPASTRCGESRMPLAKTDSSGAMRFAYCTLRAPLFFFSIAATFLFVFIPRFEP
jgi:hypothetical protein